MQVLSVASVSTPSADRGRSIPRVAVVQEQPTKQPQAPFSFSSMSHGLACATSPLRRAVSPVSPLSMRRGAAAAGSLGGAQSPAAPTGSSAAAPTPITTTSVAASPPALPGVATPVMAGGPFMHVHGAASPHQPPPVASISHVAVQPAQAPQTALLPQVPRAYRGRSYSPQRVGGGFLDTLGLLGPWGGLHGQESPRRHIGVAPPAVVLPVHRAQSSTSSLGVVLTPGAAAAAAGAFTSVTASHNLRIRSSSPLKSRQVHGAQSPVAAAMMGMPNVEGVGVVASSPCSVAKAVAAQVATTTMSAVAEGEIPATHTNDKGAGGCAVTGNDVGSSIALTGNPPDRLEPGVELTIGDNRLRIIDVLGSGSYSVVWLAKVVSSTGVCQDGVKRREQSQAEVALKDVVCKSHAALRQSLFEVQLLLALERRVLLSNSQLVKLPPRLPRCLSYRVDPFEGGWSVRTVMTRLPGEQLDDWLRRAAAVATTPAPDAPSGSRLPPWPSFLRRGALMAERLIRQVGPTLEQLAPLAWHRDVNSHNVLVSDGVDVTFLCPSDSGRNADFTLCDLGLAVDSRSWVSADGAWRVTDIGGDCRYWPASSWMVHLYGADYLTAREEFCQQYQTRLDIHGLGITAIEILCSVALAARSAGAPRVTSDEQHPDSHSCWEHLLDAWQTYHITVGHWWEMIYSVFSVGGDFQPVHAWLVQEAVADKVISLLADIRQALCNCADHTDQATGRVLRLLAELTDEASTLELSEACDLLEREDVAARISAHGHDDELGPCPFSANGIAGNSRAKVGVPLATSTVPVPSEVVSSVDCKTTLSTVVSGTGGMSSGSAEPADATAQRHTDVVAETAAATEEFRQALENLAPIPVLSPAEAYSASDRGNQRLRSRQMELAELNEAQGQLRRDLEQLQRVKLRLQRARQLHEEARQAPLGQAADGRTATSRMEGPSSSRRRAYRVLP